MSDQASTQPPQDDHSVPTPEQAGILVHAILDWLCEQEAPAILAKSGAAVEAAPVPA